MWLNERAMIKDLQPLREGSVKAALKRLAEVGKLEQGGGRGNVQYRRLSEQETVSELQETKRAEPVSSPLMKPPVTREKILAFIKSTGSEGAGDGQLDIINASDELMQGLLDDGLIVQGNDDRWRLVVAAEDAA